MAYPNQIVHRRNRRKLGRGKYPPTSLTQLVVRVAQAKRNSSTSFRVFFTQWVQAVGNDTGITVETNGSPNTVTSVQAVGGLLVVLCTDVLGPDDTSCTIDPTNAIAFQNAGNLTSPETFDVAAGP